MYKNGIFALLMLLAGCTSTNYKALEISSASMSELKINEIVNSKKGIYKLDIKFSYEISQFNLGGDIYHCSVQFLSLEEGVSTSTYKSRREPCRIDSATGQVSIRWAAPFDKTNKPTKKRMAEIRFPVQYFVAIHQKTGRYSSQVIARSEIKTLDIKI